MSFDTVIRNGTVVDGSGLAPFRADVGIRDGRIARIGRVKERGTTDIDAEGHVVTPGFIDAHTHMDAQVQRQSALAEVGGLPHRAGFPPVRSKLR